MRRECLKKHRWLATEMSQRAINMKNQSMKIDRVLLISAIFSKCANCGWGRKKSDYSRILVMGAENEENDKTEFQEWKMKR